MEEYLYSKKELIEIIKGLESEVAELKSKLEEPQLVSTHDAIKHLEQQLKDDGHETLDPKRL